MRGVEEIGIEGIDPAGDGEEFPDRIEGRRFLDDGPARKG